MQESTKSKVFFRKLCLCALLFSCVKHVFAGMLEDGEDFSNNLASDIAPLLSLFGEQVTTQFMSQSTGWADCILLSMAPIGVITILVSAIRVGGPGWLKAIIGRMRENVVAAELEIMSSTSEESCELSNGQGVVKCQGASGTREFLCIYSTEKRDGRRVSKSSQFRSVRIMEIGEATISGSKAGYLRKLEHHGSSGIDALMHFSKRLSNFLGGYKRGHDLESGNFKGMNPPERPMSSQNGPLPESGSVSQDGSKSNESTEICERVERDFKLPAPGELIIVHDPDQRAPNISLNCQAVGYRLRVWACAIISIIIQAGVLIYFGLVTELSTLRFEKDGRPVDAYAMPLTVTGTLCLVTGMLVCSHVVNKSTEETFHEVDKTTCAMTHIWLQKEKKVSGQLFESAAIYPNLTRYENITSKRRRGRDSPSAASTRSASETELRKAVTTKTRNSLETLTTAGALISVLGIAAQFTGLRGMHWTAAITQLGAVVVAAIIRALVRLRLVPPNEHKSLNPGFELDWFVTSLVGDSKPLWLPEDAKKGPSHEQDGTSISVSHDRTIGPAERTRKPPNLPFTITTHDSRFSDDSTSTDSSVQIQQEPCEQFVPDISAAQGMLNLRRHLGKLANWESPAAEQANILFRAVEETLRFFKSNFKSTFPAGSYQITMGSGLKKISFNIRFFKDAGQVSYAELDAALSTWVYSSSSKNQELDCIGNTEPKPHFMTERYPSKTEKNEIISKGTCIQVLGPSTEAMDRDLNLWLPTDMVDGQIWEKRSAEGIDQTRATHFGYSGQRSEENSQEEDTNHINPQSTGFCRDGQCSTQNNEGKPTWWTIVSHERPDKFYARDILSSFVWALAHIAALSADEKPLGASVQMSDSQGTVNLKNRDISDLVQRIVNLGSWTIREVYLCLIPPLSSSGLLPGVRPVVDQVLRTGNAFERSRKLEQAFEEYNKLRLLADDLPKGSHARWKSLAILSSFDARISKPGTRYFGSQRDDAYESEEVSAVRDKIQETFKSENERLGHYSDIRKILDTALNIYNIFDEPALKLITRGSDSSEEAELWRVANVPEGFNDYGFMAGRPTNRDRRDGIKSKRVTFDRDIFDRTPIHHAMRTNGLTKSPLLPQIDLKIFNDELDMTLQDLASQTNDQINWSKDSLLALLDPATEWATPGKFMKGEEDLQGLDLNHWTPLHYACHIILPRTRTHRTRKVEMGLEKLKEKLRIIYHERAVLRALVLIERKVDVNARGLDGTAPLHCAAASGCLQLVELLVKHKANINAQKLDGTTPLHCAVMSGSIELVKYFLRHQATETTGSDGRGLLHLAAMTDNSAKLFRVQTNTQAKDQAGRTPLHLAAVSGAMVSISELIDLGAEQDAKDRKRRTPLHLACMYDCSNSVERLLESIYIDPNAKDERGRTPLHLAALFNSQEAIKVLLRKNGGLATEAFKSSIDFEAKDMEGRSALHLASSSNAVGSVALLMQHIMDHHPEQWLPKDEDRQTPFHLAAAEGSTEAIEAMGEMIMKHNLDPTASCLLLESELDRFTAFSAAAHNGRVSSMNALLRIQATDGVISGEGLKKKLLKMKDVVGDTPYTDALRNGLSDVKWALENMVDSYEDLLPSA